MPKVVTANALTTGKVVFMGAKGGWVETLDDARLFPDADTADAGLEQAQTDVAKAIVVEPFVADARPEQDGGPKMTLRDTIRAYGPTIDYLRAPKNA